MIIQLAWRNIWRNKVRSIVIITSIAGGLLAGMFIMGLYDGVLRDRMRIVIDEEIAHLQIHHPAFKKDYDASFTITGRDSLYSQLMNIPGVRAVATRTVAQGMLATTTGSSGVQILGIYPQQEDSVSQLHSKIISGTGFTDKKNQVLIGKKLADKVKLSLGNKLVLTFIDKEAGMVSGAFRIAGIYQSDNAPLDERNVYVRATDLDRMMGLDDECHEIAILLGNAGLGETQQRVQTIAPAWLVETWKQVSPETLLLIETTDTYSVIFIVIIMLALMFGIINTMLMAILERTREIGMLIALGMNKVRLFMLVLWETVLLTLAGVPFGFVLAWSVISHYHQAGIDISSFAGEAMSGFGFNSLMYPNFPWPRLPIVLGIVCITALLASVFPAYKAVRLIPVEAMRR